MYILNYLLMNKCYSEFFKPTNKVKYIDRLVSHSDDPSPGETPGVTNVLLGNHVCLGWCLHDLDSSRTIKTFVKEQ